MTFVERGPAAANSARSVSELQFDPRLASEAKASVEFVEPSANPQFCKLHSAVLNDQELPPGTGCVVFYVRDEIGAPIAGERAVLQSELEEKIALTGDDGRAELPLPSESAFDPEGGEHGPYKAFVGGLPCDTVVGLGLPGGRGVRYELSWERVSPPAVQEPAQTSSLTGQIRNAPLNTNLILAGEGRTWSSTVGPDGVYAFNDLPAGTYFLTLAGSGVINPSIQLDGRSVSTFDYAVPFRPPAKYLQHYLLFGPPERPATLTNVILALDYIIRFSPAVGFKPEEARYAHRVTIVGDTDAVSPAVEAGLAESGCQVARITAADSYALENLFKELVISGSPYPR